MPHIDIRDASFCVNVVGRGDPLLLMHGEPGADQWTLAGMRRCGDQATPIPRQRPEQPRGRRAV